MKSAEHYSDPFAAMLGAKHERLIAVLHMRQHLIDCNLSPLPGAAALLAVRMVDISQEHYCAYWMTELEFDLWTMTKGGSRKYGNGDVAEDEIAELMALHEKCGGWIVWQDGDEYSGERFVSTEDWQRMVAERVKS